MIDYAAFYQDLEQVRQQRGLSWNAIWRILPHNVPHDVGWRIKQGDRLAKQVLAPLAEWSGLDLAKYEKQPESEAQG